jgi:IS5 family transposase
MPGMPCNATELVHFRKRIGVKGFNLIFKMSVALHGKQAQEATVLIDTTGPIIGSIAARLLHSLRFLSC